MNKIKEKTHHCPENPQVFSADLYTEWKLKSLIIKIKHRNVSKLITCAAHAITRNKHIQLKIWTSTEGELKNKLLIQLR